MPEPTESTATAAAGQDMDGALAGEPKTETTTVPKERFDEVLGERNDLRRDFQDLRTKYETLVNETLKRATTETAAPAQDPYAAEMPPEGLTQQQQVEWHVMKNIRKNKDVVAKELFGDVNLEEIKASAEAARNRTADMLERQIRSDFAAKGMDIKEPGQRAAITALLQGGMKYDDALDLMAAKWGKKPEQNGRSDAHDAVAGVMTAGVSPVKTSDTVPWNAEDASAMAAKGLSAPHMSLERIFARRERDRRR